MVDIETLRKVVASGLKDYLKCPVIRSNQNAKTPRYPYCSYTVTTVASENDGTYQEHEDGVARKGVNTILSITVQSDDNAESVTLAQKARDWLQYAGSTYLNDNGIIVQAVTSITNRDNVLTVEYEYRNGFDCIFWGYDKVGLPNLETIDAAEIDGKEIKEETVQDIIAEQNRKLDIANANFENIRKAISEKGIPIYEETPQDEYADLIGQITGGITDTELSKTSTNPVQNKVLAAAFENIDHSKLKNTDAADLHPIKAIKGLTAELDDKLEDIPTLSNLEIERIINSFT